MWSTAICGHTPCLCLYRGKMYPQMMEMHFKKKIALFWAGITYICLCLEMLGKHQKQYVLVALLLFSVLLVLIVGTGKKMKEKFVLRRHC